MPKKSKKSNGKKGGLPAMFITFLLSVSGALQGHSDEGNLLANPLINVTVVNINSNVTVNNSSSVR
ncbi:hypothetical protein [Kluyvera cryocrescens]|uniref:hypothetical protein n=1 Tax=Kluyvera cryocrescens TaxID=580 RepID=UPI000D931A67|nr:hypothetical protein [Kluyvera cryocrescens]SQC32601.1 Uncharacterised protein [Kluyvera cryocrescens]